MTYLDASLSPMSVVEPEDLPLDVPAEDDGDDRTNDVEGEEESP